MFDVVERIRDEGRIEGRNEGFAKAKEELVISPSSPMRAVSSRLRCGQNFP
ncbi:MAG: hypothetical protein IJ530_10095 [Treponema sp.]|uniref:hypothetical protein n=1 Tax=Treponema sp. TaxID=166 RepID=UPI0025D20693|nr:hypothetical protein [Treponema sp.]MBQ8680099.1 hypothetical protein [Treponema sp.]